jgi:hypothetical protein
MRQKSLIATAAVALLAGTVFAAAQGMQGQSQGGGAAPSGGAMDRGGGMERGGGAQQGSERSPGAAPTQGEERKGQSPRNRAQGQQKENRGTVGQGKGEQAEPKGRQGRESEPKAQRSQEQGKEPRTRGQGREQGQQSSPKAGRDQERGTTNGREERQPGAREGQRKGEPRTQGQRQGAGGAVNLTAEQRTHIRETVIRGGNAPRVNKVNFSISVGTVVPRSVRVVTVPSVIVDVHPQWRGYFYFVYQDEIIIVDKNHHIVAILEV